MSHRVLLSMGSNIDPARHLEAATRELARAVDLVVASPVYETAPVGSAGIVAFLNAAVEIATSLTPRDLKFEVLRPIEARLGRVRTADRSAPRTIDLDISLFDDLVVDDPEAGLRIPDPEIVSRPHVVVPLADIAPDLEHPQTGQTLREIADGLDRRDMRLCRGLVLWPQFDRFRR